MSDMVLTAGKLPEYLQADVASSLVAHRIQWNEKWDRGRKAIAEISLLNLATVCEFLNHVAELEGKQRRLRPNTFRPDRTKATKRTQFQNIPWWEASVWLPVPFDSSPHDVKNGLFVGSAVCLQEELDRIRALSPLELGSAPKGYRAMRRDYSAFSRRPFELAPGEGRDSQEVITQCVRWVWLGMHDAAEIAVRNSTPLWT